MNAEPKGGEPWGRVDSSIVQPRAAGPGCRPLSAFLRRREMMPSKCDGCGKLKPRSASRKGWHIANSVVAGVYNLWFRNCGCMSDEKFRDMIDGRCWAAMGGSDEPHRR